MQGIISPDLIMATVSPIWRSSISIKPGLKLADRKGWVQANPALGHTITEETLQSANQVQVGVKSASALNILASTVFFQADGCGYNPSGTTAFLQR